MLTDLLDWRISAASGGVTVLASCPQMHLEDAVRLTWACAQAKHSSVDPTTWVLRCESFARGPLRTIFYTAIEEGRALVPYEVLG